MDRPALWTQFCLNAWLWSFGCRRRSCGCWWCLPSGWGGPALFCSFGPVYLVPTVTRILPPCGRSLEHGVGTHPVAGLGARQTAGRVRIGGELGAQEGERETWASSGSPAVSYHVGLTAGKTCRGCLGPRFPESGPLSLRREDQAAVSPPAAGPVAPFQHFLPGGEEELGGRPVLGLQAHWQPLWPSPPGLPAAGETEAQGQSPRSLSSEMLLLEARSARPRPPAAVGVRRGHNGSREAAVPAFTGSLVRRTVWGTQNSVRPPPREARALRREKRVMSTHEPAHGCSPGLLTAGHTGSSRDALRWRTDKRTAVRPDHGTSFSEKEKRA